MELGGGVEGNVGEEMGLELMSAGWLALIQWIEWFVSVLYIS